MKRNKDLNMLPFQLEGMERFHHYNTDLGLHSLLMAMATGSGKTYTAVALLDHFFDLEEGRWLWIAPSGELVSQARSSFLSWKPEWRSMRHGPLHVPMVGTMMGSDGLDEYYAQLVLGTYQTLSKRDRAKRMFERGLFTNVISDEAHHTNCDSINNAILKTLLYMHNGDSFDKAWERAMTPGLTVKQLFDRFGSDCPVNLLGLTATPMRSDGRSLSEIYQATAFSYPISRAVSEGYLLPIDAYRVDAEVDLSGVSVSTHTNDFNQRELIAALEAQDWDSIIERKWLDYSDGGREKTFTFLKSVKMSVQYVKRLQKAGVAAAHVGSDVVIDWKGNEISSSSGKSYWDARRACLEEHREGDLNNVSGFRALMEGVDSYATLCAWAQPTLSETLFTQGVGRCVRRPKSIKRLLFDSKTDEHVLFNYNGTVDRHPSGRAPMKLHCTLLDFTGRGTNLLDSVTLFGKDASQAAKIEVLEREQTDKPEYMSLFNLDPLKQARDGQAMMSSGIVVTKRSLFRQWSEDWFEHPDTTQSVAIHPGITYFVMPARRDLVDMCNVRLQSLYQTLSTVRAYPEYVAELGDEVTIQSNIHGLEDVAAFFTQASTWEVISPYGGQKKHLNAIPKYNVPARDVASYWSTFESSPDAKAYLMNCYDGEGDAMMAAQRRVPERVQEFLSFSSNFGVTEEMSEQYRNDFYNRNSKKNKNKVNPNKDWVYTKLNSADLRMFLQEHGIQAPNMFDVQFMLVGKAFGLYRHLTAYALVMKEINRILQTWEIPVPTVEDEGLALLGV